MDLQVLLNTYNKSTLQVMARNLGIVPWPKDRTQLIDQLVETLSIAQTIEPVLATLSINERKLLEQVQLAEGDINVLQVKGNISGTAYIRAKKLIKTFILNGNLEEDATVRAANFGTQKIDGTVFGNIQRS